MDKESFTQWKENLVTMEIMGIIKEARNSYRDAIIGHAAEGESIQAARAAGMIEALDFLLNIQYEDQA